MRAIWKFPLKPAVSEIAMPVGARVLTVQTQFGEPQLWAEVDTDAPTERREFAVVGTGAPLPADTGEYIGTFQLGGGELVIHDSGVLFGKIVSAVVDHLVAAGALTREQVESGEVEYILGAIDALADRANNWDARAEKFAQSVAAVTEPSEPCALCNDYFDPDDDRWVCGMCAIPLHEIHAGKLHVTESVTEPSADQIDAAARAYAEYDNDVTWDEIRECNDSLTDSYLGASEAALRAALVVRRPTEEG